MPRSIAIVAPSPKPYQHGGAENVYEGFLHALREVPGTYAELLKHPVCDELFPELLAGYEHYYNLDLSHFDLVVSCKCPAWMTRHPRHVLYMLHPMRGLYDLYGLSGHSEELPALAGMLAEIGHLARSEKPVESDVEDMFALCKAALADPELQNERMLTMPSPLTRLVIHFFDRYAHDPARISVYTAISRTVAARRDYFPENARVHVLHFPSGFSPAPEHDGNYIFTASRLVGTKRVELLVKAMRHVRSDVKFRIAGTGSELDRLRLMAAEDQRIEFLGFVRDAELPELYAGALFVPFVPYEEDYGLITVEAMMAGKPVLTVRDSGGAAEIVEDGVSGLCVEPEPEALGCAIDLLVSDSALRARLAAGARRRVENLTWPNFVRTFLEVTNRELAAIRSSDRQKVVVLSSFAPDANGSSGGARRLYNVCSLLAEKFDVLALCVDKPERTEAEEVRVLPNFRAMLCPWPAASRALSIREQRGPSVDDWAIMRGCEHDDDLNRLAQAAFQGAGTIILEQPYLFPLCRNAGLPVIYDAHNVEAELKCQLPGWADIAADVEKTERELCAVANGVAACSAQDAAALASRYGIERSKLRIAPNGTETGNFFGRAQREHLRKVLPYRDAKLGIFIGSGHWPNVEAAQAICSFAPEMPQVQFIIVGSVCLEEALNSMKLPENVHLAGVVSENTKRVLLQAADFALNPMISGSGTNLKMVEYLDYGLEIVSTPMGARGLPDVATVHVVELPEFPQVITGILKNPAPDASLAEAAALASSRYSWPGALKELSALAEATCGTSA